MTPFFFSDNEINLLRKVIGHGIMQLNATPCFTDEHWEVKRKDENSLVALDNALRCAVIAEYNNVYVIVTRNAIVVDEATRKAYAGTINPYAYYDDIDEVFDLDKMSLKHLHNVVERVLKEGKHAYLATMFVERKDGREGYSIYRKLA